MLVTVEGVYTDGKVELSETPPVDAPARVIVTFLGGATDRQEELTREQLRQRALRRMAEGLDLGGPPYLSRESIHDRADDTASPRRV